MPEQERNIDAIVVPSVGRVEEVPGGLVPYRLVDASGAEVAAVSEFLRNLTASDCSPGTVRSYAFELLGWIRFLDAVEVSWDRASRAEARDYALWLARARKPPRQRRRDSPPPGAVNPVTGKQHPADTYSAATRRHARAVVHAFYEYHRAEHGRPLVNPFPVGRGAGDGVNSHHNPLQPWKRPGKPAPYQPRAVKRVPRAIPDARFNEVFAALSSHRDRALLAFWISTGARASELLTVVRNRVDPADQLIGVIRKGTRALQMLPASADAFVWLRLYQHELGDEVPAGPDDPLWWTHRRPFRPLSYDAARMMFGRTQQALGSNWTLHDLRHSAAYRMEGRGVASDATFRVRREDDGAGDPVGAISSPLRPARGKPQVRAGLRGTGCIGFNDVASSSVAFDASMLHQLNVKAAATRADAPSRRRAR